MTAVAILARAESAGVTLQAHGGRLRLRAGQPPSPTLLHELAGAKAELLVLLERRDDEAAERAAIQAEAQLAPPGTPERVRLDDTQRRLIMGLIKVSESGPKPAMTINLRHLEDANDP